MTSSTPENQMGKHGCDLLEYAAELGGRLLKSNVDKVTRVSGGGNNGIFRVISKQCECALKFYRQDTDDLRNRLGTEASAITFMRENGINEIPKIVAVAPDEGCTMFKWLNGKPVTSPTAADIDNMVEFIARLNGLKSNLGAERIAFASDACLSLKDIVNQTNQRLVKLQTFPELHDECRKFLKKEFKPALKEIIQREVAYLERMKFSYDDPLPQENWTLSPSDFGFHNTIRSTSGNLVFIDFEYFGWDDPAKLVCDFLLHPGMVLTEKLQDKFLTRTCSVFLENPGLRQRVEHALPLYALRWSMIVLNIFLRNDNEIEQTNIADGKSAKFLRQKRLSKAQDMLIYSLEFDPKNRWSKTFRGIADPQHC